LFEPGRVAQLFLLVVLCAVIIYFVETESLVRVLEVELEDGRKVVVPRADVEIIEE